MKLGCKKESPYNVDSQYIILRWLSNFFTIEISAIHIVDINLYPILVQEQLCKHWSLTWDSDWRYRWNRTCLDEHTFFKPLSFVFTCCVPAVLYYNSPKCHNTFVLMWILWDYSESWYVSITWMRSFKSFCFFSPILSFIVIYWCPLKPEQCDQN